MPRPTKGTDVHVYNAIDTVVPTFCNNNISPNFVTMVSILTKPYLYQLLAKSGKKSLVLIFLLMFSHAVLDCLDGEIARGCKKSSIFGSRLDSFNDFIYFGIILTFLLHTCGLVKFNTKMTILVTLLHAFFRTIVLKFDVDTHVPNGFLASLVHDNTVLLNVIVFMLTFFCLPSLLNKNSKSIR